MWRPAPAVALLLLVALVAVPGLRAQQRWLSPIVTLHHGGKLRGVETRSKSDKPVTEFLGIPYAEPPLGRLRFQAPLPKRAWPDVWDCTVRPRSCMQTREQLYINFPGAEEWNANTERSEDCLYLNIWVPGKIDPSRRLPVMVWIFGGGFWSGTSTLDVYDGKILSTEEQVIVVSMNYRVSLFGFLYLGIPRAPGNVGLLDQLEALKWVHENIRFFGGDRSQVTLFGESAGAASVSMHVLSPLSQSYFQRAILQSGTALSPWAMESTDVMLERAMLIGNFCSCDVNLNEPSSSDNIEKLLKCLLNIDAELLLEKEWLTSDFNDFPWTPVVDNYFLTEQPATTLKRGNFNRSQLLVGSNLNESIYFIVYTSPVFNKSRMFETDQFLVSDELFEQVSVELMPEPLKRNDAVREAILYEYGDWTLPGDARRRQDSLDKMYGDYHFTCSVNEYAQLFDAGGGIVYYYYFTHRSSQQSWPAWMGPMHGYEIHFIFGEPLNSHNFSYTQEEKELSRRIMRYWANFARTG